MKKNISILAAMLLASCTAQIEPLASDPVEGQENLVTFSFSAETVVTHGQPQIQGRTTIDGSMNVSWTAGDKITVFANGTGTLFTADAAGSATTFSGSAPAAAEVYYALYPRDPYDIAASISGNVISTVIPNCQTGVKDGFDPLAQVMVGRSTTGVFEMKNAVALVKVEIPADVTSVTLATNNGTQGLAGATSITVGSDGVPTAVSATAKSVLLLPSGDTFEAGDYYIAVAPGTVTGGLKILMTKSTDDNIYSVSSGATANFYRSEMTWLKNVGSKLSPTTVSQKVSIVFSDGSSWKNPFFWGDTDTGTSDYSTATSSIASSNGSATFSEEDRAFYVRNGSPNTNGSCLQLNVYAKEGVWRNSKQGFGCGRDKNDYIALPYRNNGRLVAVRITPGTASSQGYAAVTGTDGTIVNGGDSYHFKTTIGKSVIWHNLDAANATRYRITMQNTANAFMIRQLDLFYVFDSNVATPANARTLPPTVSGTIITMNGTCNRWQAGSWSDYTAGFEYKTSAQTWGDATNVNFGTLSGASWSKDVVLPAGDYTCRAWVQSGSVKYYGNGHAFTVSAAPVDPEYTFTTFDVNFPTNYDNTIYPLNGSWNAGLAGKSLPIIELVGNHNTMLAYVDYESTVVGVRYLSSGYILGGNAATKPVNTAYFLLPAINGLSLSEVTATLGSGSTAGGWAVIDETLTGTTSDVTGGDAVDVAAGTSPGKYTLSGTTAGKAYKLWFTGKGSAQLSGLTVKYTGTEAATVQYVCPPAYSAGTASARVYVNAVCTAGDLSGGFQYKAGGAGDWTALGAAGFSALSSGVTTASLSASLSAGDVVRAFVSDGTKTVYSPEFTVE